MTGSDRSGNGPSGIDYSDSTSCDDLSFEALVTSPKPVTVNMLTVYDILTIETVNVDGQIVVQLLHKGKLVGGLTGPDASRLRTCIDQGYRFRATVRALDRGQVRVFVEPS